MLKIRNKYITTVGTKVFLTLLNVTSSILINRYLGPSIKGEYVYILNIINITSLVLNLGLYQSYPFFKREGILNVQNKFVTNVFIQFFVYLIICVILTILFPNNKLFFSILLIPLMVIVRQLIFIILVDKINLRNIITIIHQTFFVIILLISFFFINSSLRVIIILMYISYLFNIVILLIALRNNLFPLDFDFSFLVRSIRFGFFPMLTSLLISLNYKIDILILGNYVSFEQIGLYSTGVGLAQIAWLIPDAFKEVLFHKTSQSDSIKEIVIGIKFNLYLSVIIWLIVVFFGQYGIVLLYGNAYKDSYEVTKLIFLGIIPMIFHKLITTLLIAKGKQKLCFFFFSISSIVNIISNFILIPIYEINGAAFSSIISNSLCGVLFLAYFIKMTNIKLHNFFIINKREIIFLRNLIMSLYKKH